MLTKRRRHSAGFVILSGVVSLVSLGATPALAQGCNRACLIDMMTQFIDALAAHDPSRLPLADNLRYTEDSRFAELGEGIWQSITAKGEFRQDYVDTQKGVIASHIHLYEDDVQVLYSALLYVADSEIAGIETLVLRVGTDAFNPPSSARRFAA